MDNGLFLYTFFLKCLKQEIPFKLILNCNIHACMNTLCSTKLTLTFNFSYSITQKDNLALDKKLPIEIKEYSITLISKREDN